MLHYGSGLFYVLWLTIGLACSLRIASEFFLATTIRRQGFLVGAVVAAVHWLYLYYLKYAYHSFVAGKLPLDCFPHAYLHAHFCV